MYCIFNNCEMEMEEKDWKTGQNPHIKSMNNKEFIAEYSVAGHPLTLGDRFPYQK